MYVLLLTTAGIGQVAAMVGLPQIITRAVSRNLHAVGFIARQVFPLIVMGSLVAGSGVTGYLIWFADVEQFLPLVACIALVASQGVWVFAESLAFGKQQMHFSSLLNMGGSVCWLAIVFLLPARFCTVEFIVGAFAAIQLLRSLVYVFLEWRYGYFAGGAVEEKSPDLTRISFLKQSLPLFGTNVLTIPISQLPILFLAKFSGTAQVGYFGIGNRLVAPLFLVSGSLMSAVFPILSRSYVEDRPRFSMLIQRLFWGLAAVGFLFAFLFGMFSKEIVLVLFGNGYAEGIIPFAIQVWTACIMMMLSFVGNIFLSANKERTLVALSIFNGIVIGVSSYVGAHFGAFGLAISSWGGLVAGFALHWFVLRRKIMTEPFTMKFAEVSIFSIYIVLSGVVLLLAPVSFIIRAGTLVLVTAVLAMIGRSQVSELLQYLRRTLSGNAGASAATILSGK